MKKAFVIFLAGIAVALLAIQFTPIETLAPKLSHHVVFVYLCGSPEGILLTTNPPVWVSDFYPPSDLHDSLIEEAIKAERTVAVFLFRLGCPEPKVRT